MILEIILYSIGSIFAVSGSVYGIIKFTKYYAELENREALIKISKLINLRLKNEELKGICDSEEVKTLKALNKDIETFLKT